MSEFSELNIRKSENKFLYAILLEVSGPINFGKIRDLGNILTVTRQPLVNSEPGVLSHYRSNYEGERAGIFPFSIQGQALQCGLPRYPNITQGHYNIFKLVTEGMHIVYFKLHNNFPELNVCQGSGVLANPKDGDREDWGTCQSRKEEREDRRREMGRGRRKGWRRDNGMSMSEDSD